MLVELQSGALVFTRSFTDAFDLRYPRSERMNLGALLFALLSFAGTLHGCALANRRLVCLARTMVVGVFLTSMVCVCRQ